MTGEQLQREIEAYIAAHPMKDGGLLVLAAAAAFLNKRTAYSPGGSDLMRLAKQDASLTVCLASHRAAGQLSIAYDALKESMGVGGGN